MSVPRVGTQFAGYRIEGVLGRGGMGVVYRAINPRLGTAVALKLLVPELADEEAFRERFVRESRQAAGLNHPNVVTIFDAGDSDGVLYIAMRLVEGRDLKDLVRNKGALGLERTLNLLRQAGSALDAAHAQGLIHRDVKPGNILIEEGGDPDLPERVYLADFGLTKHVHSTSGLTASGAFVGTIDYMAPEQIEGAAVDGRTDVYSLGCVAFECLTGRPPFRKETDAAVLWAHMREDPPAVAKLRPELPRAVDAVVRKALAKKPDERFGSCRELVRALDEIAEPGSGERPEADRAGRVARPRRRTIAAVLVVAAAAAAAGAAAGFLLTRGNDERTTTVTVDVPDEPLTAADRVVLEYVPAAVRRTCEHTRVPNPDFLATVACSPGGFAVTYNLARSAAALDSQLRKRVVAERLGRADAQLKAVSACGVGTRSLRAWRASPPAGHAELLGGVAGAQAGAVLCYRQNGWASIEWTDSRLDVYSIAFGDDLDRLLGWWRRSGGPVQPTLTRAAPPAAAPPATSAPPLGPPAAPPPPPPPPPTTIVVG